MSGTPADQPITADEVMRWVNDLCYQHAFADLAQVLNGEYSVAAARADCLSVVRPPPEPEESTTTTEGANL